MKKPIQISIPTPCHENWTEMTPADKGRFCASCQKTVIDFTKSSDREIVQAFKDNSNLCGRFRTDQLERDLVIPQEKKTLWAAAAATVLTLLTAGNNEAVAQTPANTEQHVKKTDDIKVSDSKKEPFILKGFVRDTMGTALPNAYIINLKNRKEKIPVNADGSYTIEVIAGESIGFVCEGYVADSFVVTEGLKTYTVRLMVIAPITALGTPNIKE